MRVAYPNCWMLLHIRLWWANKQAMWPAFTARSTYKKRAKFAAVAWTLLILFACFIPGKEIPDMKVPLADKWTHFLLFGGYSLLWCLAYPGAGMLRLLLIFGSGCILGWLVEELQGLLSFLGRSKDTMDAFADMLGALSGVLLFYIFALTARRRSLRGKS